MPADAAKARDVTKADLERLKERARVVATTPWRVATMAPEEKLWPETGKAGTTCAAPAGLH